MVSSRKFVRASLRSSALAVLIAAAVVLSGCSVLSGVVNTATNKAVSAAMQPTIQQAQFSAVYGSVFYFGGFGLDYGDAKLGQLLEWRMDATDKNGTDTVWADRALLRKEADGSQWWYLAYRTKEDNLEYAVKLDSDHNPLLLRFKNKETGQIQELKYDKAEAQKGKDQMKQENTQATASSTQGSSEVVTDPSVYNQYKKSTETISVGAGTFTCDKLENTYTDPNDSSTRVTYTWWVSKDLPGVVKYDWENLKDNNSVKGELTKRQDGFSTPLLQ
ncbi:MAG TPA: hypothetical protein VMW87_01680 [Spirochaetia bacterium]|nr:hypothetical protein [Spirochaetia bacterium]